MKNRTGDANDHKAKGGRFSLADTEPVELPPEEQPEDGQVDEGEANALPESNILDGKWKWLGERDGWLSTEPPRRTYLLLAEKGGKGLLPLGKAGMLAAGGGMGKSWALVQLALAVATGRPWLDTYPVTTEGEGPVLLALAEEEEEEVRRRLFLAAQAMNLSAYERKRAEDRILPLPLCGDHVALTYGPEELAATHAADPSSIAAIETPFARELRTMLSLDETLWKLVILDPLSRFAGPDVEKDNAQATRFVQLAERLTRLPGNPTVLLSHHTNKTSRATSNTQAGAARGASALTDGFRWQANLEVLFHAKNKATEAKDEPRQELTDYTRLRVTKNNYGQRPEALYLRRDTDHHGVLVPVAASEVERLQRETEAEEDEDGQVQPVATGSPGVLEDQL